MKKRPTGSATGLEFPVLNSSFHRVSQSTKPGTSSSPNRKPNILKGGIILPEAKNGENSTFSLPKKNIKFNYQRKERSQSKQAPPKRESDFPRVFKRNKKSLGHFTPTSSQKSFKIEKRKLNILEAQSAKSQSKTGSTNRSGFTNSNRMASLDRMPDNEHFIRQEDGDDKTEKDRIKAPQSSPQNVRAQEIEKQHSETSRVPINRKSPIQVTHGENTLEIMQKSYISATAGIKSERSVSRTSVDLEMGLASGKVLFIKPEYSIHDEYNKSKSKESTRHQSLMSSRVPYNAKAPKSCNNINFTSFGVSKTPKNVNFRRNTQGPGNTFRGAGRSTPQPPDTPQSKHEFPQKVSCYPFTMAAFQEFKITNHQTLSPNSQQTLAPKQEPRNVSLTRKDNQSFLQNLTRLANNGFSKAVRKMIPIKQQTGILIRFQHNLKSLDSNDLKSLCIKNRASESSATTTSTLADKVSSYKSTLRDGKAFVLPLLK